MTDRFGVVYTIGPSPLEAQDRLGGHRRWPDPRHARRRRELERRHSAGDDGVEQGLADRGRPLRCGDGLCVGGPSSPGRRPAVHLSHARRRQDLDRTWSNGIPERRLRQLRKGRPEAEGACSTPPPNCACTFHSTTAIIGSRCRTTCRSLRCATSSCTATILLSLRMAADSGCWTR